LDPVKDIDLEFETAYSNLKAQASPGIPYMLDCATVDDFKAKFGKADIRECVYARLNLLAVYGSDKIAGMTPLEIVEAGLADPIRVFIKNEVHTTDKVKTGRYRLIHSVSVIDQLVERILGQRQNEHEISNYTEYPSKPGMGLHDEGLEILHAQIKAMDKPTGSDVSGWDTGVDDWQMTMDAEVRASRNPQLGSLLLSRAKILARKLFVFGDGSRYQQTKPGFWPSGSYWTSSSNSRNRFGVEVLVKYDVTGVVGANAITQGDDCVSDINWTDEQTLRRAYQRRGVDLKVLQPPPKVSFCSYQFDINNLFLPYVVDDPSKRITNFFYHWPIASEFDERLAQLEYELRFSGCEIMIQASDLAHAVKSEQVGVLKSTDDIVAKCPPTQQSAAATGANPDKPN
jgi:hypothetical protein